MTDRSLRICLVFLTAVAAVTFVAGVSGPVRIAAVTGFVLLCPGIAWARLFRTGDLADTVGIGITISVALAAVVAQAMALASWWSPGTGFAVLAGLTLAGLAIAPRDDPAESGGEAHA